MKSCIILWVALFCGVAVTSVPVPEYRNSYVTRKLPSITYDTLVGYRDAKSGKQNGNGGYSDYFTKDWSEDQEGSETVGTITAGATAYQLMRMIMR